MVGKDCNRLALNIRVVATKIGKWPKCVKHGVKGVAHAIGERGLMVFSTGEEMIAKGVKQFSTGTVGRERGREGKAKFAL